MRSKKQTIIISICLLLIIGLTGCNKQEKKPKTDNGEIVSSDISEREIMDSQTVGLSARVSELKNKWNETCEYPITPACEEWSEYTMQECQEILNPPENILENMSTEQIVDLMVEYPYSRTMSAYNSRDQFFLFLKNKCDLFSEWLKREDGLTKIIDKFANHTIDIDKLNSLSEDTEGYEEAGVNTEVFICQIIKYYWGDMEEVEKENYRSIAGTKEILYSQVTSTATKEKLNRNKEIDEYVD